MFVHFPLLFATTNNNQKRKNNYLDEIMLQQLSTLSLSLSICLSLAGKDMK